MVNSIIRLIFKYAADQSILVNSALLLETVCLLPVHEVLKPGWHVNVSLQMSPLREFFSQQVVIVSSWFWRVRVSSKAPIFAIYSNLVRAIFAASAYFLSQVQCSSSASEKLLP